jgi:uncharacterized membrane protein
MKGNSDAGSKAASLGGRWHLAWLGHGWILRWNRVPSDFAVASYADQRRLPTNQCGNLNLNTLADGLFHAATYLFTLIGLTVLWRASTHSGVTWSARVLIGAVLIGWGMFNLVEGLIDHQLLGIHHVRDDLPPGRAKLGWDLGFLAWGALMLVVGWRVARN